MLVTVAICTLNCAESLRQTLASLAAMRIPEGLEWEVLVVNNGSTDHTETVIDDFAGRLPIRSELEPQRGHTPARNRVVVAARGEYIVWTDDDVLVAPGWLAAFVDAFQRWPDAALFGGPVIPRYGPAPPKWLTDCLTVVAPMVAYRDFGVEPLPLSVAGTRIPYGPSFAMRAAEHRKFPFDPVFGAAPGQRRVGEETDVFARVLESGAPGYWVPAARVEHCFGPERQALLYLVKYFENYGETGALRDSGATAATVFWFGIPRWVWRQLLGGWLGYQFHRLTSPPQVWLAHLRDYAIARGAFRFWRNKRPNVGESAWTNAAVSNAKENTRS